MTVWRRYSVSPAIHGRVLLHFAFAAIVFALVALYVWEDRPDASDAGKHSLSGWLVDTFGVQWARPAGVAVFSALALLLIAAIVWDMRRLRKLGR